MGWRDEVDNITGGGLPGIPGLPDNWNNGLKDFAYGWVNPVVDAAGAMASGNFNGAILNGLRSPFSNALSLAMKTPDIPSLPGSPDVPSSLSGESGSPTYAMERHNRKRPGEPIPVLYGTHRVVPDLISSPYLFRGDNLYGSSIYYFSNLVITCGAVSINTASFKFGEESIAMSQFLDFDTVIAPSVVSDVYNLPETAVGYLITNTFSNYWTVWEPVAININSWPYTALQLKFKIGFVFPTGLYEISGGSPIARSVTFEITKEIVNATTNAIISSSTTTLTITANSLKTYYYGHSDAINNIHPYLERGRVKIRRTTAESTTVSIRDAAQLGMVLGYVPTSGYFNHSDYAIISISKRFDIDGQNHQFGAFSLVASRAIPVWNGTSWSAPTQTRSIAWALADILRNASYGAGLDDSEIDLAALLALDAVWSARGDEFNGVFDQTITIWEALTRIARAGRAVPVLQGGVVTFVRDDAKTTHTAIFGPENILPGSLAIDYRIADENEPDGVRVTYIDPTTWQEATVDYQIGGGTPLDPREVNLFGCTSAAMALREATYQARVDAYRRQTIRWQTEFDALLVNIGDLVSIAHDVPGWGASCEMIDLTGSTVTTSESLYFGSTPFSVAFRKPDGSVAGPFTATMLTGEYKRFTFTGSLGFTPNTDPSAGVRTVILAGTATPWGKDVIIASIKPIGPTTFEITAVPYDARIYAAGA